MRARTKTQHNVKRITALLEPNHLSDELSTRAPFEDIKFPASAPTSRRVPFESDSQNPFQRSEFGFKTLPRPPSPTQQKKMDEAKRRLRKKLRKEARKYSHTLRSNRAVQLNLVHTHTPALTRQARRFDESTVRGDQTNRPY